MATYSFPAASFAIEGDPQAVRDTASTYGRFAITAGQAAADLRSLDAGSWVGSEGDLFRTRVAELPPHLDTAHGAFAQTARALDGFADVLESARRQMLGVRADAEQTFRSLASARSDRAGLREPSLEEATADPSVRSAYDERRHLLEGRIGQLQATYGDQVTAAAGLRDRVAEASRQAATAIRAAGRTSPTADQSWLADTWEDARRWASDRLDDLKDFVAEHAGFFRGLAKTLRVVGLVLVAVGAVLAVLGVGGAVMTAGFLLVGAGSALDSTVDWAEGRITGRQLLVSAGLAIGLSVVGGGAAKLGAEALRRLAPRLHRFTGEVLKPRLADKGDLVGHPRGRGGLAKRSTTWRLNTGARLGREPTPETIREGSVRMKEHPLYPETVREMEEAGFRLVETSGDPHVVVRRLVDARGQVIGVERELHAQSSMRFLDLEHELGHVRQLTDPNRFPDGPPPTEVMEQRPDGTLTKARDQSGILTRRQDSIAEYHVRLEEFVRLSDPQRGTSPEILREHAAGVDSARRRYWHKGLQGGNSKRLLAWADQHFPEIRDLEERVADARERLLGP